MPVGPFELTHGGESQSFSGTGSQRPNDEAVGSSDARYPLRHVSSAPCPTSQRLLDMGVRKTGSGRFDIGDNMSVRQIVKQAFTQPKKTVKFKPVDQAGVELLKYKPNTPDEADVDAEDSSVTLSYEYEASSFCTKCWHVFCGGERDDVEVEEAHTWMEVTLWKLNASADLETEGADISNWRRRLFLLQEHDKKLAMMYTSEKENGSLHIGCIIYQQGAELAQRTILPEVKLRPMTPETQEQQIMTMREYDIAFSARQNRQFYLEILPKILNPFVITWIDDKGAEQKLTLASVNAKVPSHLVESMSSIAQIMRTKAAAADHHRT